MELKIIEPVVNRKINQLFSYIAAEIYKSDMNHNDTKSWWPIRWREPKHVPRLFGCCSANQTVFDYL